MRGNVDVCCAGRIPPGEDASDGDNPVGVGGLKPTGERFPLFCLEEIVSCSVMLC